MLSVVPQVKDSFFYNSNLVFQGQIPEAQSTQWLALTCCAARAGGTWVLYENVGISQSMFRYFNFATLSVTIETVIAGTYGERLGLHSLHELPGGDLLTVNRATHAMTRINPTTGAIVFTSALVANPFDAWVSPDSSKLAYMSGNILKQWNLNTNSALADIVNFGAPYIMPVWLSDGTFILYTDTFNNSGAHNVLRTNAAGAVTQTYTGYTFSGGGIRGIAASVQGNIVYIFGSNDYGGGDIFSIIRFNMSAATLTDQTTVVGPILTTFAYFDQATGFVNWFESNITALSINCDTQIATVTGTDFPVSPTVYMKKNGIAFTDFTIVSSNSTTILISIAGFQDGNYEVAVV